MTAIRSPRRDCRRQSSDGISTATHQAEIDEHEFSPETESSAMLPEGAASDIGGAGMVGRSERTRRVWCDRMRPPASSAAEPDARCVRQEDQSSTQADFIIWSPRSAGRGQDHRKQPVDPRPAQLEFAVGRSLCWRPGGDHAPHQCSIDSISASTPKISPAQRRIARCLSHKRSCHRKITRDQRRSDQHQVGDRRRIFDFSAEHEDIHMNIEARLAELMGLAGRLHTAGLAMTRSRPIYGCGFFWARRDRSPRPCNARSAEALIDPRERKPPP